MDISPSDKMSIFPSAIFGDLKAAAEKKRLLGTEIIDLSLGSPDLPPHQIVRDALAKSSAKENMYGYTLGGTNKFNQAVCDYYKRRSNVMLDPKEEVLQTMGSQEGLVHFPMAFCNEGDIVLTTDPAYVAYDAGIKLAGAEPYYMKLEQKNGFLPDLDTVPEKIAQKAKLLILNLPGNPVPATPDKAYFEKVVRFAKKYQIIVLHDAAYSEFYFEGDHPVSFLETPDAKDVGAEINSLSKSFSLAGARIAYIVGNKDIIRIMKEFKSNLDYGTFAPIQEAGIAALNHAELITDQLRKTFSERHHLLMDGLTGLGWETASSNGGMFVWANYPNEMDDVAFVYHAIEKAGVVMVPGSIFGENGKGYVRIALVQDKERIKKALEQLKEL